MSMTIVGLGSNLGDRLGNLRRGLQEICKIPGTAICQISPVYVSDALLPENAPADWDRPYFNFAVRCETSLSPAEWLIQLKQAEKSAGRLPEKPWGPRIIDIDLLAFENLVIANDQLKLPHPPLPDRPFALWPLADVAPAWVHPLTGKSAAMMAEAFGSRFSGSAPFHTRQIHQRIESPRLVGILNLTPDSFSDGGSFANTEAALQHAVRLVNEGAEILDIGAEATNPGASPLPAETEWQRLEPLLAALIREKKNMLLRPLVSIDTRHPEVAKKALQTGGVDWINDVSGLDSPAMCRVIADNPCEVVFMHHLGIPVRPDTIMDPLANPVETIFHWAEAKIKMLARLGIGRERLIFDPGIGFGKSATQSFAILRDLAVFRALGTRILAGHSRKRFLELFTGDNFSGRDPETAFLSQQLHGLADFVRVHNVLMSARGFRIASAFSHSPPVMNNFLLHNASRDISMTD